MYSCKYHPKNVAVVARHEAQVKTVLFLIFDLCEFVLMNISKLSHNMIKRAGDPFTLQGKWLNIAEEELNEDPSTARLNVELLRNNVLAEDHLYARTDDIFLLSFLRARKHNVEEAFKVLKNFYKMKKEYPKHFEDCLPTEKAFAYDVNGFTVLEDYDQHGRPVIIARVEHVDLNKLRQEHFFQMLSSLIQVMLEDPRVQTSGVTAIMDLQGFHLHHARIINPTFAYIAMRLAQDSFPVRVKAVHVVNEPFYFDAIYTLFKPFLKEKLKNRIHLHGHDMSSLHAHVPTQILPKALGGLDKDWNFDEFRQIMTQHEEQIREWRKFGYNKKPGTSS